MHRLRALGAGWGWRCPDVGAGTGTIARRLLDEAGVASVLAVDRDVRFPAGQPVAGLELLEADVTAPDFAPGRFRLVHARFVLMHLPEHERLIGKPAGLLEPGGVPVLGDAVDLMSDRPPLNGDPPPGVRRVRRPVGRHAHRLGKETPGDAALTRPGPSAGAPGPRRPLRRAGLRRARDRFRAVAKRHQAV